jgi:phosphate-selective porin OprO/OprP
MQFRAETAEYIEGVLRIFGIVLLLWVTPAVAQTPVNSAPAPPAGTPPAFVVQSDDGDNRLQLGAVVQADARFAIDDSQHHVVDTFMMRRVRAQAQGRVARYFDFYLNVDFAGGLVNLRDAYFETTFSSWFHVRAGKMKAPFSYDRNARAAAVLLGERGLTTTVAPDRDIGVQLLGDLAGERVSYAVALTNGVIDGGSAEGDTNDAKDVTGRIVARPWTRSPRHPLSGLGLAVAANTGSHGPALPSFSSAGARQTFFRYASAEESGSRSRWSPQAFYYRGPFGGYTEFVRSSGHITKDGVTGAINHDAWQVTGSWVLTGEAAAAGYVRPRVNFDPANRQFGALQVAARVERLAVSREAVIRGLTASGASRTADAWTAGLNWYLNPYVKWHVGFTRTVFDGDADGPRHAENLLLGRAQVSF